MTYPVLRQVSKRTVLCWFDFGEHNIIYCQGPSNGFYGEYHNEKAGAATLKGALKRAITSIQPLDTRP